jgi:hypothetical protein
MRVVVELTEREAGELQRAEVRPRFSHSTESTAPIARELEAAHRKISDAIDAARFLDRVGS